MNTGESMRSWLMSCMAHLCRHQQLEWAKHDKFIDRTDHSMGDLDVLVELMLICGTDYITVMRVAMSLEEGP